MIKFTDCIAKRNGSEYQVVGLVNNFVYSKTRNKQFQLCITSGIFETCQHPDTLSLPRPTSRITTGERTVLKLANGSSQVQKQLSAAETEALKLGILKTTDYFWNEHYGEIRLNPFLDGLNCPRWLKWREFMSNWDLRETQSAAGADLRPIVVAFFSGVDPDKIIKGVKSMYGYQVDKLRQNYLSGGYELSTTLEELVEDVARNHVVTQ